MHVYTSVTTNYIPKARVLASSLKRFHPEARFHLVLADALPTDFILDDEPFDSVIFAATLPIPDVHGWLFRHRLVEMCTAVKGAAMREIARRYNPETVFYFDPDIVILSPLDDLLKLLQQHSIVLTPHQSVPETTIDAIADNEICSLKHGVFNLGFVAIRNSSEGRRFADWWAERLQHFCYDEPHRGLFTDQRWVDLAPVFFEDLGIARGPQYNVATWNLTHRRATGIAPYGIRINDVPLCFYHFSGFDSGAQLTMLKKYGDASPVLFELRDWYINRCNEMGQEELGDIPCVYSHFDNGVAITNDHRRLYRHRVDLQKAFPNPYLAGDANHSFLHWFEANSGAAQIATDAQHARLLAESSRMHGQLQQMSQEIDRLKSSRSWRVATMLSKTAGALNLRR